MDVFLVQEVHVASQAFHLPLFASDGQWKEWKLPFSVFVANEAGQTLDPALPTTIEVHVPFQENWDAWHFRVRPGASCGLMMDDVGYWRATGPVASTLVEGFDDDRDMLPFVMDLYGSSSWMDYTQKDTGEEKLNAGVRGQTQALSRVGGGPEGSYLRLDGRLDLTPEIAAYHAAGQSLTLFLKAPFARSLTGAHAISFLVRSGLVRRGSIEIQDEANDRSYGADFAVIGDWARVRIPFDRLRTPDGSLAEAKPLPEMPRLQLSFELPPGEVEAAAAAGPLSFSVGLDSFALEP